MPPAWSLLLWCAASAAALAPPSSTHLAARSSAVTSRPGVNTNVQDRESASLKQYLLERMKTESVGLVNQRHALLTPREIVMDFQKWSANPNEAFSTVSKKPAVREVPMSSVFPRFRPPTLASKATTTTTTTVSPRTSAPRNYRPPQRRARSTTTTTTAKPPADPQKPLKPLSEMIYSSSLDAMFMNSNMDTSSSDVLYKNRVYSAKPRVVDANSTKWTPITIHSWHPSRSLDHQDGSNFNFEGGEKELGHKQLSRIPEYRHSDSFRKKISPTSQVEHLKGDGIAGGNYKLMNMKSRPYYSNNNQQFEPNPAALLPSQMNSTEKELKTITSTPFAFDMAPPFFSTLTQIEEPTNKSSPSTEFGVNFRKDRNGHFLNYEPHYSTISKNTEELGKMETDDIKLFNIKASESQENDPVLYRSKVYGSKPYYYKTRTGNQNLEKNPNDLKSKVPFQLSTESYQEYTRSEDLLRYSSRYHKEIDNNRTKSEEKLKVKPIRYRIYHKPETNSKYGRDRQSSKFTEVTFYSPVNNRSSEATKSLNQDSNTRYIKNYDPAYRYRTIPLRTTFYQSDDQSNRSKFSDGKYKEVPTIDEKDASFHEYVKEENVSKSDERYLNNQHDSSIATFEKRHPSYRETEEMRTNHKFLNLKPNSSNKDQPVVHRSSSRDKTNQSPGPTVSRGRLRDKKKGPKVIDELSVHHIAGPPYHDSIPVDVVRTLEKEDGPHYIPKTVTSKEILDSYEIEDEEFFDDDSLSFDDPNIFHLDEGEPDDARERKYVVNDHPIDVTEKRRKVYDFSINTRDFGKVIDIQIPSKFLEPADINVDDIDGMVYDYENFKHHRHNKNRYAVPPKDSFHLKETFDKKVNVDHFEIKDPLRHRDNIKPKAIVFVTKEEHKTDPIPGLKPGNTRATTGSDEDWRAMYRDFHVSDPKHDFHDLNIGSLEYMRDQNPHDAVDIHHHPSNSRSPRIDENQFNEHYVIRVSEVEEPTPQNHVFEHPPDNLHEFSYEPPRNLLPWNGRESQLAGSLPRKDREYRQMTENKQDMMYDFDFGDYHNSDYNYQKNVRPVTVRRRKDNKARIKRRNRDGSSWNLRDVWNFRLPSEIRRNMREFILG